MTASPPEHPDIAALGARAWKRLCDAGAQPDPALEARCRRVALVSDFAIDTLVRQPAVLAWLADNDGATPMPHPLLLADNRSEWPRLLRRYRLAESTRLAWRDALGLDDVDATLAGSTRLAETCLALALEALEREFALRHGVVREGSLRQAQGLPAAALEDERGSAVRLVVFGLGKLGGGELNFSSDIDLVYGYESGGTSDGARPLEAEDYFARLGQQLARLLDEVTADGFSHRVDLRLRPFGSAGRVVLSFAAMEQYFQREGRDWERYAWQKARPVAGDIGAGERFLATLRPFVYRRYLDYGALDGLREMKAAIAAEVARKELVDDIKRGPGGIREIEFLAQALQLIRGGREPALQERRLLPALRALTAARQVDADVLATLVEAYRFLRRLENRLQMIGDAQTHVLPADAMARLRLATGLGFADWDALREALDGHRARVAAEFAALLAPRARRVQPGALSAYWRALPDGGDSEALADAGFADAAALDAALRDFVRSIGVRALGDAARARLDRVLPALLQAASASSQPHAALRRVLALLQNILRRNSYLALLDEQPAALARLVDAVVRSAFLAERLAALPLLLDELLDARVAGPLPERGDFAPACAAALAHDDVETALNALNETKQALGFRIALATLDGRQRAQDSARQLAWLAGSVIDVALELALREVRASHGDVAGARFAVVGYGSLGGEELGFGSDLDLVFLYDAPAHAQSDAGRAVDAPRWCTRLAQKLVALLGTVTAAGRLYDIDVRLRPDGGNGLLVSSLASYGDYQRNRAWTWEHQALVRARGVAGDAGLQTAFAQIRADTLARVRDADTLRGDVASMRLRMRAELDRSDAAGFDLKQGAGGLVDLEFALQYLVLRDAHARPALLSPCDTPGLIDALHAARALSATSADALRAAHGALLAAGLECTLDRRRRWVVENAEVARARRQVHEGLASIGLAFG